MGLGAMRCVGSGEGEEKDDEIEGSREGRGDQAWELGKPSQKRRFGSQGNEEKYTHVSAVPPAAAAAAAEAAAKRPPLGVGAGNLPLRLAAMLLLPRVAMTTAPGPREATSMKSIRRNSRWNHIRNDGSRGGARATHIALALDLSRVVDNFTFRSIPTCINVCR
uniref:Uncharacterized protein n=1 Tax=Oryza rufipogon TaxID=4529 RepID=A0A0E0N701_ORYRU